MSFYGRRLYSHQRGIILEIKICYALGPESYGGIETHIVQISKHFVEAGHSVEYICAASPTNPKYEDLDGIKITRLGNKSVRKSFRAGYLSPKIQFLYIPRLFQKILLSTKKSDVDVINSHTLSINLGSGTASRLKGIPNILTNHGTYYEIWAEMKGKFGSLLKWYEKLTVKYTHYDVMACTDAITADLALKWGIESDRLDVIPNGVDLERFHPNNTSEIKKELDIEECPVILSPRRLVPKNGIEFLIRSAPGILKSVPNAKILIIGDGPQRTYLESLSKLLKVQESVLFLGSKKREEMPSYFAAADVIVLPSLAEATSIVALESFAAGKPVVATEVGGLPEIVDSYVGAVVRAKSIFQLADSISMLLNDPQKAKKLGLNARTYVENYHSWKKVSAHYLELFEKVSHH